MGRLVLTRKFGQRVIIHAGIETIEIEVYEQAGKDAVRLAFIASKNVEIWREEIDHKR